MPTKDNFKKSLKSKIYKWGTVATVIAGSYVYGTFQPNDYVRSKIIHKVEAQVVASANSFGLHEPEFVYNDPESFVTAVKNCIDYVNFRTEPSKRIPSAIVIGMAGVESGWGTSRFATEGNNLFGIRTWDPKVPHLKPLDIPNADFGVKVYETKCQSVQHMYDLLNNHGAYKKFREERQSQYEAGKWNYRALLETLDAWSTNPDYAGIVFDAIITRQLP